MKKLFGLLFVALLLIVPTAAYAEDKAPVNVYLFHGATCPHCQELIEWFDSIEDKYGDKYNLIKYEVWNDAKNAELLTSTADSFGLNTDNIGVPFLVIGNEHLEGFSPDEDPEVILQLIENEYNVNESERVNFVDDVIAKTGWTHDAPEKDKKITDLIIGVVAIVVVVGIVVVVVKAREE